jgi:hypothetical protein
MEKMKKEENTLVSRIKGRMVGQEKGCLGRRLSGNPLSTVARYSFVLTLPDQLKPRFQISDSRFRISQSFQIL